MILIDNIKRKLANLSDENGKVDYLDALNYLNEIDGLNEEECNIINAALITTTQELSIGLQTMEVELADLLQLSDHIPKIFKTIKKFNDLTTGIKSPTMEDLNEFKAKYKSTNQV